MSLQSLRDRRAMDAFLDSTAQYRSGYRGVRTNALRRGRDVVTGVLRYNLLTREFIAEPAR